MLLFGTWETDSNPDWTILLYKKIKRASSDICGCVFCKVWSARREKAFCDACRKHLEQAGIDLKLDAANSPVMLDGEMVYVVQYRIKGVVQNPKKSYECPGCRTRGWVVQDRHERHLIQLNLSVTVPLDAAARDQIAAAQVVKGNR